MLKEKKSDLCRLLRVLIAHHTGHLTLRTYSLISCLFRIPLCGPEIHPLMRALYELDRFSLTMLILLAGLQLL